MFLKNVFKFVFKLERNYLYFLLQAWQILLHLREYAGFYVLQHRLRINGKIPNISWYNYFKPEEFGFRAWEFQSIGPGKLIPYQPIDFHSSYDVLLNFQENCHQKKQAV